MDIFWIFMILLFCTPFGWIGLALLVCLVLALTGGIPKPEDKSEKEE
jgi:hypothetical protein